MMPSVGIAKNFKRSPWRASLKVSVKVLIRSGRFLKLEIPLDGVRGALWFSCYESLLQPQMDSFLLWGRLSTLFVQS